MKTIKATGEQVCNDRKELVDKYFGGFGVYGEGNMGIISLLSDCQEEIAMSSIGRKEEYRQILNDIKCILIEDGRRLEDAKVRQDADSKYIKHLEEGVIGGKKGGVK